MTRETVMTKETVMKKLTTAKKRGEADGAMQVLPADAGEGAFRPG